MYHIMVVTPEGTKYLCKNASLISDRDSAGVWTTNITNMKSTIEYYDSFFAHHYEMFVSPVVDIHARVALLCTL